MRYREWSRSWESRMWRVRKKAKLRRKSRVLPPRPIKMWSWYTRKFKSRRKRLKVDHRQLGMERLRRSTCLWNRIASKHRALKSIREPRALPLVKMAHVWTELDLHPLAAVEGRFRSWNASNPVYRLLHRCLRPASKKPRKQAPAPTTRYRQNQPWNKGHRLHSLARRWSTSAASKAYKSKTSSPSTTTPPVLLSTGYQQVIRVQRCRLIRHQADYEHLFV